MQGMSLQDTRDTESTGQAFPVPPLSTSLASFPPSCPRSLSCDHHALHQSYSSLSVRSWGGANTDMDYAAAESRIHETGETEDFLSAED